MASKKVEEKKQRCECSHIHDAAVCSADGCGCKEPIPETPRTRFKRLAIPRVIGVLNSLRILGNCSGSAYEYTDAQVDEMFSAIRGSLEAAELKFKQPKQVTFEFHG